MTLRFLHLVLLFFTISQLPAQYCFFTSASSIEASPGSNICVKINVHNYENVIGMQYTINWDSLVLRYTGSTDYELPGITVGNFGTPVPGVLTFSWADPFFMGSDLPDRTHVYSICFDVIGELDESTSIDFSSSHTPIEIVDGNIEPIPFNYVAGEVLVKAIPTGGEKLRSGACITSPSCLNNEESALRLVVEGGQDPIAVEWTGPGGFTSTDFDFENLEPGTYYASISDGIGFSRVDSFEIEDLIPRLRGEVVKDVKCFGQQNGSINITVEEGTEPYSYAWSNGSAFEDLSGLLPGSYTVTFTDALGCSGTGDFLIGTPDQIVMETPVTQCPGLGMDNGMASVAVTGGVTPYVFFWSNGMQTSVGELGSLAEGDYMVTMTDANNCPFVIDSFELETGIDSLQAMYFTCGGSDVPLSITATNATSYSWSPADLLSCTDCPDPSINTNTDTTVMVTVQTASGCTQTGTLMVVTDDDCVWPGDCNNDGIANYLDVLWIGLANGVTGPERTVQTSNWQGLGAVDWSESTPVTMINHKFIDADGNGVINEADLDPILANYDMEHNFIPPNVEEKSLEDVPPLLISLPDTVLDETMLEFDLTLGSSEEAIASAYGLAFQLRYDSDLIVPNTMLLTQDGWLGTDLWEIKVNMPAMGLLEVGLSRKFGNGVSGEGKIGTLALVFEKVDNPTPTSFTIQNAYLINEGEGPIPVAAQTTSTIIIPEIIDGLKELNPQDFSETIHPNPVIHTLYVESERFIDFYQLIGLDGKLIEENSFSNAPIDVKSLTSGIYILRLIGKDGVTTHKTMVE